MMLSIKDLRSHSIPALTLALLLYPGLCLAFVPIQSGDNAVGGASSWPQWQAPRRLSRDRETGAAFSTLSATAHASASANATSSTSSNTQSKQGNCTARSSASAEARAGSQHRQDHESDNKTSHKGNCRAEASSKASASVGDSSGERGSGNTRGTN